MPLEGGTAHQAVESIHRIHPHPFRASGNTQRPFPKPFGSWPSDFKEGRPQEKSALHERWIYSTNRLFGRAFAKRNEAILVVGEDDADGLKIGIDDRRPDVFHAALPQIGGDLFREGRSSLSMLDDRTRRKRGKIGGKASPFPFDREVGPGVNDRAFRLWRIVRQLSPAWKPSRTSISKSFLSSSRGRPHSSS